MTDLSKTIAPKSDQLNADDLITGARTIKITGVKKSETPDQPISVYFEGDNGKPFKPCKSMRRVMVQVWGTDGGSYVGKSMTIFRDDKVQFGGTAVGGIRISHMSALKEKISVMLTASKTKRAAYIILPLEVKEDTLSQRAEQAAKGGTESYKSFFTALSADDKKRLADRHEEFKKTASDSDAEKAALNG